MTIHTSFIMAAYNRAELLNITLHGYRRYAASQEGVELVVADYGSTDNLRGVLEDAAGVFGRIRLLTLDRRRSTVPINPTYNNPSVPWNVAVRSAVAPLIVMSPPECYPLNDNFAAAAKIMEGGRRQACLFGKALMMPPYAATFVRPAQWLPRTEKEVRERIPTRILVQASREDGILGAAPFFMAFRKQDHAAIHGVDEEYSRGWGSEDVDYTTRLKKAGAEHLWDDRCGVLHLWHPRLQTDPPGTPPQRPPNRNRDGIKANMAHEWGSLDMVTKEVTIT